MHISVVAGQFPVTLNIQHNLEQIVSIVQSADAENQRFVVSANTAHPLQHCPTMIISPRGEILREVVSDRAETLRQRISLADNANWYLNQCRTDLVSLTYQDQRMGLE